jgi:cysteine-rich repeat protein
MVGGTVCAFSTFASPITGTVDTATGDARLSFQLTWYGGWDTCSSCGTPENSPQIGDTFLCEQGGSPCTVDSVTSYGGFSFDCAPNIAFGSLGYRTVQVNELTTGTVTRVAELPCASPVEKTCSDLPTYGSPACSTNADCKRCTLDSSTACFSDAECNGNGFCAEAPEQPVTCGKLCHCGFCDGNYNLPCFGSIDCRNGQTCEPSADISFFQSQGRPNACTADNWDCGDPGAEQCATTTAAFCSEDRSWPCSTNTSICEDNDRGICTVEPLPCFGNHVTRTGDAMAGDDGILHPVMVALYCDVGIGGTTDSNAGITGPVAVRWKTNIKPCSCTATVEEDCEDVCSHVEHCGDGKVQPNEDCDGTKCCEKNCTFKSSAAACRPSSNACDIAEFCTGASSTCGTDIRLANGIACDDGAACSVSDTCVAGVCLGTTITCGNGTFDPQCEQCDDGNDIGGDGCSKFCQVEPLCGDATRDGKVMTSDAHRILQRAVGLNVSCHPALCDVNGSGAIGTIDALLVLRAAVGLPANLACDL